MKRTSTLALQVVAAGTLLMSLVAAFLVATRAKDLGQAYSFAIALVVLVQGSLASCFCFVFAGIAEDLSALRNQGTP